jgi:hypothetical protein
MRWGWRRREFPGTDRDADDGALAKRDRDFVLAESVHDLGERYAAFGNGRGDADQRDGQSRRELQRFAGVL